MSHALVTRRLFLADLGRGAFALAVFGLAGCAPSGSTARPSGSLAASGSSPGAGSSPGSGASTPPSSSADPAASAPPPASGAAGAVTWARVNLGFVSAYLLVRGGEAAVVDTGVAGSEDEIAAGLAGIGLDWSAVGHVILTHRHADHAGSATAVLEAAPAATGYIGSADLAAVQTPRPLTAVNDGDAVFGLKIVGTPGHTAGHIAVLDDIGGVLLAGDALRTTGGTLTGSSPQNTEDMAAAQASVVKLGTLTFETLLVGHGDPILAGASAQVKALAG
jgi:glyoxylase-like metal-dependent hydrolase (beta-lactamase superfamily II)